MFKIIFLQPGYAHYRDQLFTLLSHKYNIHFIYESSKNTYPGEGKPSGINYSYLNQKPFLKWLSLLCHLIKDDPDIVVTSVSAAFRTMIAYVYTRIFRKKIILWIEEWRSPSYPKISLRYIKMSLRYILSNIRYKIGKKILLKSDALVVGGTASRNYALSIGKKEEQVFTSLQCAPDLRANDLDRINIQKGKEHYTFLYLSRIINWKGLDVLIEAFSKLEKERSDVFLLIAGDGPFKDHCVCLSHSLKINHVKFLGAIDSKKTWEVFAEADIFVLPSCFRDNLYEGWGLVINEAMSMGLPIITTTAVGASYDLIQHGKNGFIVKDKNVSQLYKAMRKILDLDLKKMGAWSRRIFEEKNSFVKMAEGFNDAICYVFNKL